MVIGLAGYAQSGKDTLLLQLQGLGDKKYVRFAFADALKHEIKQRISDEYGIDVFNCTSEEKNSVRHLMVELGAARRAEDPNYWINQTLANIKQAMEEDPSIIPVITDVRYENEADILEAEFPGSKLVVINRYGNGPANDQEAEFTSKLYAREGGSVIQFFWSDITNYTQRDLDVLVGGLESLI